MLNELGGTQGGMNKSYSAHVLLFESLLRLVSITSLLRNTALSVFHPENASQEVASTGIKVFYLPYTRDFCLITYDTTISGRRNNSPRHRASILRQSHSGWLVGDSETITQVIEYASAIPRKMLGSAQRHIRVRSTRGVERSARKSEYTVHSLLYLHYYVGIAFCTEWCTERVRASSHANPFKRQMHGGADVAETCGYEISGRVLDRMENESLNMLKGKSMKFDLSKNDYYWFKFDAPLGKEFDQFCKRWLGKEDIKEELDDGKWSTYVPNEEWKRLELEKMLPSNASYECIGEYGLMINDDDLEHMFVYLLTKDVPSFMEVEKDDVEGKKSKMIGTPCERAKDLYKEFDDEARDNGFVNTSGCNDVELTKE
ncbi:hypothetical protein Tco_1193205 [Tanacetum coccineum]